jgi:geranylgeranylglycerol-phosphate geranylgeranyltransferase
MNKVKSYLEISRPVNVIITFLVVYVAGIICGDDIFFSINLLLAGFAASFTAAAGNVINDVFDYKIDKINRPLRPLPSGKLVKSDAVIFYLMLVSASIVLSYFISIPALIIVIMTNLILYFYSKLLKGMPLAGNIAVSICTGLAFIFGGVAVGSIENSILPALFAFLITIIREIIKDIEDVDGDSQHEKVTLPIKYGLSVTKISVLVFIVLLISATIYPFVVEMYRIEYLLIVLFFVDLPLVYVIKEIFSGNFLSKLSFLSLKLKVLMIFGLIAIFIGKY